MNSNVGRARIGQWYTRWDSGEIFQVTALATQSGAIEIQSFDGDVYEIADVSWPLLPLGLTDPPPGWVNSSDTADLSDLDAAIAAEFRHTQMGDCASTSMVSEDLSQNNDASNASVRRGSHE